MKYVCFGYLDAENWDKKSESERNALIDECFTYDDALRRDGNWVSGEGLQVGATTLSYKNGHVTVTDGPYIETKDLLGGVMILEARDLNHAIQLIANHPGIKMGPWELRPVQDLSGTIRESEKRRRSIRK